MATKPKRGDLIAISRGGYQHWAVYVGNGYVIHLALNSERADVGSCCGSPVGQEKAIVKREKLKDVAGKDNYNIRNHLDNQYKPRPIEEILRDALSRVGEMIPYNVLKNNCEHFATWLRYGKPESQQAQKAEAAAAVGVFGALITAVVAIGIAVVVNLCTPENDKKIEKEKNKHGNGK